MPHTISTDIDEFAQSLIDAFDLTFEEDEPQLSDPLIRWLDFRFRYIDPRPRQVLKSIDFDNRIPTETKSALENFILLSESGSDLNPYQTKTIKRNDSSGTKRQLRTDGLWADWQILHAHLTTEPLVSGSDFSERSEWLLFFLVQPDHIFLIDVRSHDEPGIFQAIDLVEKAIRSWPEFGEKFAVKGALRLAQPPETSASAIKQIRTGGVSQLLEIDGVVYMSPGLGVTSASTSVRVSLERNRVKQLAENIGTFFTNTDGEPMRTVRARGVTDPSFSLQLSPQGRLIIVCPEAAIHWPFPSASHQQDARVQLEQALLPAWASAKLAPFLAARLAKERCKAEHLAQKKFQAGGASDGDAAE